MQNCSRRNGNNTGEHNKTLITEKLCKYQQRRSNFNNTSKPKKGMKEKKEYRNIYEALEPKDKEQQNQKRTRRVIKNTAFKF